MPAWLIIINDLSGKKVRVTGKIWTNHKATNVVIFQNRNGTSRVLYRDDNLLKNDLTENLKYIIAVPQIVME
jgi:hypothetical protein